jgi:hypothetical protein
MNRQHSKFTNGEAARKKWKKPLSEGCIDIIEFKKIMIQYNFEIIKSADIILDTGENNTCIKAVPVDNNCWKKECDLLYLFVCNNKIMKIGGTRKGLNERWTSYKCGHCVPERKDKNGKNYPGKMSVTNAHCYHTIEDSLLNENLWEIWSFTLPKIVLTREVFGKTITIYPQIYHAYESRCIELFQEKAGHIPQLCNNADPNYRLKKMKKMKKKDIIEKLTKMGLDTKGNKKVLITRLTTALKGIDN